MIVYCDTSFLVSLLNEDDTNHARATKTSYQWDAHDFIVCALHLVELPAAVRAATQRQVSAIPAHVARRVINRFDRAVTSGVFLRRELPLSESVAMARTLGDAHGWKRRQTAFDLWHVAAAWSLSAGAFLSFDKRQVGIATTLGMSVSRPT